MSGSALRRQNYRPYKIGRHGQIQGGWTTTTRRCRITATRRNFLASFPMPRSPRTQRRNWLRLRAHRLNGENAPGGYEEGSWGRNLLMLYQARLGDREAAYACLNTLFSRRGDRSLMVGTKFAPRNAYEMDYNTAPPPASPRCCCRHQGYLHLLPALPAAWPDGQVRVCVCARRLPRGDDVEGRQAC